MKWEYREHTFRLPESQVLTPELLQDCLNRLPGWEVFALAPAVKSKPNRAGQWHLSRLDFIPVEEIDYSIQIRQITCWCRRPVLDAEKLAESNLLARDATYCKELNFGDL
jgi:hypothetical protein